ncbi:MAG: dTDP-4-dehydrorhamnose 3,5-epimerase [Pseudomonadota bacterium]|jgi:dTDP-4-dehydrorhamnose 3,5-epimerase
MSLDAIQTFALPGVVLVRPPVYRDARGSLSPWFEAPRDAAAGWPEVVQVNHVRSAGGVLRGLHWQWTRPQAKVVRVLRGAILDVVVDLDPASPTYRGHVAVHLDAATDAQLVVPAGYAHGYVVLSDDGAEVLYGLDAPYDPAGAAGVRWDDPGLGIRWGVARPLLSAADAAWPSLDALDPASLPRRP